MKFIARFFLLNSIKRTEEIGRNKREESQSGSCQQVSRKDDKQRIKKGEREKKRRTVMSNKFVSLRRGVVVEL